MRLFALDAAMGLLLAVSLVSLIFCFFLYRYRRTKGPLLMSVASLLVLMGSLGHVIDTFDILNIGTMVPLVTIAAGAILAAVAVALWRK